MHGTMPDESDQLTLPSAGDFVDDELAKEISRAYPDAQHTKQMIKAIKERHSTVESTSGTIMVDLPVNGKPTSFDITACMLKACGGMIPPVVEGLGKLVATFDPEFQDKLKGRVLLAGGGSMIQGLDKAIEAYMREHLGSGKVVRIEEPIYGGANGALKIAHDMPEDYWTELQE
jgi:rod shape-determining protein MreB